MNDTINSREQVLNRATEEGGETLHGAVLQVRVLRVIDVGDGRLRQFRACRDVNLRQVQHRHDDAKPVRQRRRDRHRTERPKLFSGQFTSLHGE